MTQPPSSRSPSGPSPAGVRPAGRAPRWWAWAAALCGLAGSPRLLGPGPAAAAPDTPEPAALGRYGPVEEVRTAGAGHRARLQLLRGPLTAPQPGLPPHEAAARALAELRRIVPSLIPPELGAPAVQEVGTAHLLRYGQQHRGVPILDTVTQPARVTRVGKNTFRIVLTQGLTIRSPSTSEDRLNVDVVLATWERVPEEEEEG